MLIALFRLVALWELFCHIDKDKDMQLTAEELQNALSKAGELDLPTRLRQPVAQAEGCSNINFHFCRHYDLAAKA